MSRLNRDAKRTLRHCRACGASIFILLRTDRRYCTDACRKWWQRRPGVTRIYAQRGVVRLPNRPGWGQPKTLAEALKLLLETRAYAKKLEAAAEALTHKLAEQDAARAELQNELNRAQAQAAQEQDAKIASAQPASANSRNSSAGPSDTTPPPTPLLIAELRQQIASLTEALAETKRQSRAERRELLDKIDGHKRELRRLDHRLERAMEEQKE